MYVEEARRCQNILREIALKPDPLSTEQYIDLLIEAERGTFPDHMVDRAEELQELVVN